jgi:hypothetical protein
MHLGVPKIAISLVKVPGDVPGRNMVPTGKGTEEMGKILTHPLFNMYHFFQWGIYLGHIGSKEKVPKDPTVQILKVLEEGQLLIEQKQVVLKDWQFGKGCGFEVGLKIYLKCQ